MMRSPYRWNACLAACLATTLFVAGCGRGAHEDAGGGGADSAAPDATTQQAPHAGGETATATTLDFASAPEMPAPGTPATWTLTIHDRGTGAPVAQFDTVHEKLMHLIILSKDLAWFNHIHPVYKGNGVFTVEVTLPRAADYKLYADYTVGGKHEVQQHEIPASARSAVASLGLVADTAGEGGWMLRSTTAKPEGMPEATGGAAYQVALMPMPAHIVAGKDVMLHFQVRDANGRSLDHLEPYLGAMGHAVLLSADTKIYLHTHPMEPGADHGGMHHDHGAATVAATTGPKGGGTAGATAGVMAGEEEEETTKPHHDHGGKPHEHAAASGGANVMFHTNFPQPGLYKVWGQFQYGGKIITGAFVVQVTAS